MNSHGLLCVNKAKIFFYPIYDSILSQWVCIKILSVHVFYQLSTLTEVCSKCILVSWKVLWNDVKSTEYHS
jgi:hypothetical protein